jgi:hypothetical protein
MPGMRGARCEEPSYAPDGVDPRRRLVDRRELRRVDLRQATLFICFSASGLCRPSRSQLPYSLISGRNHIASGIYQVA